MRYGRSRIILRLRERKGGLRIGVTDHGDELPADRRDRPPHDEPSGRGLLVVAALAIEWGVRRIPGRPGKTVWADLAGDPSPA